MPAIVVNDPANVVVDGVPGGSFIDVLINHDPDIKLGLEPTDASGIRSGLLAAMIAWSKSVSDSHATAIANLIASHTGTVASLTARSQQEADTARAASEAILAEKDASIADRDTTHAKALAERDAVHAEELAAKDADAIAKLVAEHAEVVAGFQATIASQNAQISDLKSQVEALGGTELGKQMAKNAAIKAAEDAVAKAAADLAKLQAGE